MLIKLSAASLPNRVIIKTISLILRATQCFKKNREKFLAEHKDRSGKRIQSADLNKIMGEAWQKMDKAEQQPYYDEAKQLREDHQSKYPNWTAR